MIQFDEAAVRYLRAFRKGTADEDSISASGKLEITEDLYNETLKKIFLKPFQSQPFTFEFQSPGGEGATLQNIIKELGNQDEFEKLSEKIIHHLAVCFSDSETSFGDVFVMQFEDVQLNGEYYDAIGIYKYLEKEKFIETGLGGDMVELAFRSGIGSAKPEKACLVLFSGSDFTILNLEKNQKESEIWQEEFISLKAKNDFVNHTNDMLNMTKTFITDQIPNEYEVTKADQIDLLNKSVEYFKSNAKFDKNEFEDTVFHDEGVKESFRDYDSQYKKNHDLEFEDSFEISPQAVKKQARIFKSVLKLDKNFHIYIHGNRELIEQGVDDNGRKFYKIYYEQEK